MPSPLAPKLAALVAILDGAAVLEHLPPEQAKRFATATAELLRELVAAVDGLGEPARAGIAAGLESAGRTMATLGPGLADLERRHDAMAAAVADLAARVEQLRAAAAGAAAGRTEPPAAG